jgi:hypothetical protein
MLEQQMAAVLGTGRWCSGRVACRDTRTGHRVDEFTLVPRLIQIRGVFQPVDGQASAATEVVTLSI